MALKKKTLRLDYFTVLCFEKSQDDCGNEEAMERILDMSKSFEEMSEMSAASRDIVNKNGEVIRVQVVRPHVFADIKDKNGEPLKIWELEVLKERVSSNPGLATSKGEYHPIELNEGERICEDVTALYDPDKGVVVVYRKKEALTPNGIADTLGKMLSEPTLHFKSLIEPATLEALQGNKLYSKIEVIISNDNKNTEMSVTDAMREGLKLNAATVHLTYSLGRKKKDSDPTLNSDFLKGLTKKYLMNPGLKKLEIKARENEGDELETYDLIEERIHDLITLEFDKKNPITHNKVYQVMELGYIKRRDSLNILI